MNNRNSLYMIITILIVINVVTISMFWGRQFFNPFSKISGNWFGGMMGQGSMMHSSDDLDEHDHSTSEFSTWEGMLSHMEEEHGKGSMMHKETTYDKPVAETHKKTYDFGKIKRSEGVISTTFEIENHGKEPLIIGDISTSCGCTTAQVANNQLGFNEETELTTVNFDPNFHEEPLGKITRSVFVKTNDPDPPKMQFDVYVEIID